MSSRADDWRQSIKSAKSPDKWPRALEKARVLQNELAAEVLVEDRCPAINCVAGIDVGFENGGKIARAAAVVLSFPDLTVLDSAIGKSPARFPYILGYLSFRELPVVLDALSKLVTVPNIIVCDGQGIAHPRRLGIASHLGVLLNIATVGVGKTRLIGTYQEPKNHKGAWSPLSDKGEAIGAVLRTRRNVKPIYVSVGHKISLPSAIDIVLRCCTRYKIPETTRHAHRLASSK